MEKGKGSSRTRHRPPSRLRYEHSHPVVSFRVEREVYQQLKDMLDRSGKSIGDLFREALRIQRASTGRAYQQGYRKGYEDARGRYQVTYPCSICGERIELTSPNEKGAVAEYMDEHGWGHAACHQKRRAGAR